MEYEEISLKEFILILIKGWKWIVRSTLITTLIAIIYTLAFKPVLYESTSSLIITIPANVVTEYGTYTLPSTNVADYMTYLTSDDVVNDVIQQLNLDLDTNSLKNKLTYSIDINTVPSTIITKVTDPNPELAAQIHQIWLSSYSNYLNKTYNTLALNTLLAQNENLLASLNTELIGIDNQLLVLNDYKKTLTFDTGKAIDVSVNNLLYYKVFDQQIDLELRQNEINLMITPLEDSINSLKTIIGSNKADNSVNILGNAIILPANIDTPTTALSRGLALNAAIGFVLGTMMGVFIVFFNNYWKSESISKV